MDDFSDFAAEYQELVHNIMMAGYQTYEQKLQDWFDFLDSSPLARERVRQLEAKVDFEPWYEAGKQTVSGMVGSGALKWARDRTERLGQQLALFRHFATNEDAWSDYTTNFLWAGSRYDDNIYKLNAQVFEPFARQLLRDLEGQVTSRPSAAPAADRIVALDHNSQGYQEAMAQLVHVTETLRSSNEIGAAFPEGRNRVVSELAAGRTLLGAQQVRAQAAWVVLYPALRWVADHAAGAAIGVVVTALIVVIASLLGVQVPGL